MVNITGIMTRIQKIKKANRLRLHILIALAAVLVSIADDVEDSGGSLKGTLNC